MDDFRVLGEISNAETIAEGASIRDLERLAKAYGGGKKWRKLKGVATVELANGKIRRSRFTGMRLTASAARN